MTDRCDPGQTARLAGDITQAYREHAAAEAAKHPVTYDEASAWDRPIAGARARYEELTSRDATARAIAALKARGEWTRERARVLDPDDYPPLTPAERLEILANGEVLARHYRHPAEAGHAVRAGATWDQVAAAAGTTSGTARAAYVQWAEGQHQYAGMTDDEYTAALELAARGS